MVKYTGNKDIGDIHCNKTKKSFRCYKVVKGLEPTKIPEDARLSRKPYNIKNKKDIEKLLKYHIQQANRYKYMEVPKDVLQEISRQYNKLIDTLRTIKENVGVLRPEQTVGELRLNIIPFRKLLDNYNIDIDEKIFYKDYKKRLEYIKEEQANRQLVKDYKKFFDTILKGYANKSQKKQLEIRQQIKNKYDYMIKKIGYIPKDRYYTNAKLESDDMKAFLNTRGTKKYTLAPKNNFGPISSKIF